MTADDETWDGLTVARVGSGEGVLWLHGYTMRAQVFAPLWERLPGWGHVAVDLPFHGGSRPLRDGEHLADLADLLASRVAALGVRHVVALSLGTVVAAELALRHPTACATWTLAAPALAGMPHEPAVRERYAALARLRRSGGTDEQLTQLWLTDPPAIFAGVHARPAVAREVRRVVAAHRWAELDDDRWRALFDARQQACDLAATSGRVLVVTGERDLLTHRLCARAIVSAVPGAELSVLPGCGHLAVVEEPAAAAGVLAAHWRGDVAPVLRR